MENYAELLIIAFKLSASNYFEAVVDFGSADQCLAASHFPIHPTHCWIFSYFLSLFFYKSMIWKTMEKLIIVFQSRKSN